MAKFVKVGDIFQILSCEGICYGQVLHTHPKWKHVVGIFYDFVEKEPADFSTYVSRTPDFISMFLINIAVKRGYFSIVGHAPVAACNASFPIFRGTNNPGQGEQTMWWFWDGNSEWRSDHPLTEEERRYPAGPSLPSAPLLIKYVEDRYRVETDFV